MKIEFRKRALVCKAVYGDGSVNSMLANVFGFFRRYLCDPIDFLARGSNTPRPQTQLSKPKRFNEIIRSLE